MTPFDVVMMNYITLFLVTIMLASLAQGFEFQTHAQNLDFESIDSDNNATGENRTLNQENYDTLVFEFKNSNIENNFKSWDLVSGNWNFSSTALKGGTSDNSTSPVENTLVYSQVLPNLSAISTSVKINSLDNELANYVYLINSYVDSGNFNKAGIHIFDNNVYVRFAEVSNGSVVSEPLHPYIDTGIRYQPGMIFNITLVFDDQFQSLFLNGTQYAGNDESNIDGLVGLNYGRIKDIQFNNFTITPINYIDPSLKIINYSPKDAVVEDSESIWLADRTLPEGSYLHLYDSAPFGIGNGHLTARLPCSEDSNTEIQILAGPIHNLSSSTLDTISELSDPGSICTYETTISSTGNNKTTDIFLLNNSTEDIDFPVTSSISIKADRMFE
jgi:hypothetical protein